MTDTSIWTRMGATPRKMALVAVLAVVLVVVIVVQYATGSTTPRRSVKLDRRADPKSQKQPSGQTTRKTGGDSRSMPTRREWPKVTVDEAAGQNPFALTTELLSAENIVLGETDEERAAAKHRAEKQLKQLQQQGVSLAIVSDQGGAAKIGDRTVRVGELLDGWRVVEIRPNGTVIVQFEE